MMGNMTLKSDHILTKILTIQEIVISEKSGNFNIVNSQASKIDLKS
jgi:hypothetical protein